MTNFPHGAPSARDVQGGVSADAITAELFPAAWEKLPFGLCLIDGRGTIVVVNPAFTEILGYSRAELLGAMFTMLFPPPGPLVPSFTKAAGRFSRIPRIRG